MRKIMVSGFLGADAQKQISKQNREYVSFRMANREYNDPKGADGLTQTTWMRVTCFNPRMMTFAGNLKKGSYVTVIGDLNLGTYQNKMGSISIDVDVVADSVCYTNSGDANKNITSNSGANQYSMPTTGNYGGNTNKPYSATSAPQASMPTATSMPTASPSVVAAPITSSGDDDDLPF